MIYKIVSNEKNKNIEELREINKIYKFENELLQQLFADTTDNRAKEIRLASIVASIPKDEEYNDEIFHIECNLEGKIDNFILRNNINRGSSDELNGFDLELILLSNIEFIYGYRIPVDNRNTLEEELNTVELTTEERLNIIKAFILVDYILDRNTYITEVNKTTENQNGKIILTFGKDDF